jgi:O-antigen ligase
MRQFLLVFLFAVLLSDIMLGPGLSLAPGLSFKNAMLYVLFTALVLEFLLGSRDMLRETWPLHTAWALLAFYATFTWLAIVLLGLHRGYDTVGSFILLKAQLVDLFLFLLVYLYAPKDAKKSVLVLKWLIMLLVVFNFVTMVDFLNIPNLGVIPDRADGRVTGPVKEVNQYGAILIFMIPVTAGLAMASSGMLRLMLGLGAGLAGLLLVFTVSRGSYVGFAVGGIVALYLVRDHVRKESIIKGALIIALVLTISVVALLILNPEGFLKKFDLGGATLDRISSGRLDVWQRLLTMMSYQPVSFVTGFGWNSYRALIGIFGDPHNTYLLYWFNLGLIGLGLYLFIVGWVVKFSVSSLRYLRTSTKPLVIGFVVGFIALHIAISFVLVYSPWPFIWAITGTILRVIVDERREMMLSATTQEDEEN